MIVRKEKKKKMRNRDYPKERGKDKESCACSYGSATGITYAMNYETVSFFVPYTYSTAGTKSLKLLYACTGVGGTSYINKARIRTYVVKHP